MQDHTLAGLADNFKIPWRQFFPQLFQVVDKCCPSNVHLIRKLVREERSIRAHQFSEDIVLSSAKRAEHTVNPAYLLIFFFIGDRVKYAKMISSLHSFEPRAVFQVRIKLFNIIADRAFTD